MGNLYIIPTLHNDFIEGPKKLRCLYDKINPQVILSEMSPEIPNLVQNLFEEWKTSMKDVPDKDFLDKLVFSFQKNSLGFEYPVNRDYALEQNIPHYLIDFSDKFYYSSLKSFQLYLEEIKNNIKSCPSSLKKIIGELDDLVICFSPKQGKRIWDFFRRNEGTILGELSLFPYRFLFKRIGTSDEYMEKRIREIYTPEKVIALTVGMAHGIDSLNGSTLYSRLKDLHPERIPLI